MGRSDIAVDFEPHLIPFWTTLHYYEQERGIIFRDDGQSRSVGRHPTHLGASFAAVPKHHWCR
jgi:hypothetical protein